MGSGCGTEGRAAASDPANPDLNRVAGNFYFLQLFGTEENKAKEAEGIWTNQKSKIGWEWHNIITQLVKMDGCFFHEQRIFECTNNNTRENKNNWNKNIF